MKKLTAVLACVFLFLVLMTVLSCRTSLDALDGVIFGLLSQEDTEYASGYSDTAFRDIEIGMTEQEVLVLLGEPINRYRLTGQPLEDWSRSFNIESVCWEYSRSPSDSDYRMRYIYVKDGKVVGKRAGYWVD